MAFPNISSRSRGARDNAIVGYGNRIIRKVGPCLMIPIERKGLAGASRSPVDTFRLPYFAAARDKGGDVE